MTGLRYTYRSSRKQALTDGYGENIRAYGPFVCIVSLSINILLLVGAQQYSSVLIQKMKVAAKEEHARRIQAVIDDIYSRLKDNDDGELASYIPQLAEADPNVFGIAFCDIDGKLYTAGDTNVPASIQSVSKTLLYLMAMMERGRAKVGMKVGEEPSGMPFNELAIDSENRAYNALINTGALTTASLLKGTALDRYERFENLCRACCHAPDGIALDEAVYQSEMATNDNNRKIVDELVSHGIIENEPDVALEAYTRVCSSNVTALDVAVMGATFANGGVHPITKKKAIPGKLTNQLVTVMMSCGMYNGAGKWIVEVGIPAKSGVSGHLLCVVCRRV